MLMKLKVELTEAEKRTLQQLSRKHSYQDFRTRGLGLLFLGDARRICDIAEELKVSAKSVCNWAHAWQDKGLCGLPLGHKGGRPRALSEAMITTAVEAARSESMTLKQIAQQIEAIHDVPLPCGLDTLSVTLKHAGFSFKRGRYSLKKNETNRSSR